LNCWAARPSILDYGWELSCLCDDIADLFGQGCYAVEAGAFHEFNQLVFTSLNLYSGRSKPGGQLSALWGGSFFIALLTGFLERK
jgi:hypothetical protein